MAARAEAVEGGRRALGPRSAVGPGRCAMGGGAAGAAFVGAAVGRAGAGRAGVRPQRGGSGRGTTRAGPARGAWLPPYCPAGPVAPFIAREGQRANRGLGARRVRGERGRPGLAWPRSRRGAVGDGQRCFLAGKRGLALFRIGVWPGGSGGAGRHRELPAGW